MSGETVFVELRAGEGGDDAKRLVENLFAIYVKRCRAHGERDSRL